eukprot:COSAG01_NODE_76515_length_183_cov_22.511905_1_plen_23_part_10
MQQALGAQALTRGAWQTAAQTLF